MLHSTDSGRTVAQSMLRFNQIDTGRRLIGVTLGLTFMLMGGGALARTGTQAIDLGPVQGWVGK